MKIWGETTKIFEYLLLLLRGGNTYNLAFAYHGKRKRFLKQ